MAMTYTSLTAPKGTSGSIANWVSYTKLDIGPIVDEAQALIYQYLRCREMRTEIKFIMPASNAYQALPVGFLDPIGTMFAPSTNYRFIHVDEGYVQNKRNYQETTGTLGTNPFTTSTGSNTVTVFLANHGFNQASVFYTTGATTFNGVTIVGSFPINSIIDVNDFTIDISILGTTPTGSGAGGGSSVTYTCDNLVALTPMWWSIWNEAIQFDGAFLTQTSCTLLYFQSLPLLSNTNQSNFLTNRYPQLMRTACVTAAADFMKDDNEYQKGMQRMQGVIMQIQAQDDLIYRGAEIQTFTE
jgi:hypothetical protein